jgi:hypothetical protein
MQDARTLLATVRTLVSNVTVLAVGAAALAVGAAALAVRATVPAGAKALVPGAAALAVGAKALAVGTTSLALVATALTPGATACAPQQKAAQDAIPASRTSPGYAPAAPPYVPFVAWGEPTIHTRVDQIGPRARGRWKRWFEAAGVDYPARYVVLVGLKREKQLEVYAGPSRQRLAYVRRMPMTAASGGPGPKLREGDLQVPEGIYEVDRLNPHSAYHVSLRLAYPNAFDERMAMRDGRRRLGGQIMIHGNAKSIGCIAVGDEGAEDLFVLAADAGVGGTTVVIVPRDFRRTKERETLPGQPAWLPELYARLDGELRTLPPREPQPAVAAHPPAHPTTAPAAVKRVRPPRISANELDARRRALAAKRRIVPAPRPLVAPRPRNPGADTRNATGEP